MNEEFKLQMADGRLVDVGFASLYKVMISPKTISVCTTKTVFTMFFLRLASTTFSHSSCFDIISKSYDLQSFQEAYDPGVACLLVVLTRQAVTRREVVLEIRD